MLKADTCLFKYEELNGKLYERTCEPDNERCGDCGILKKSGSAHHPGCDKEYCPVCRMQAMGCDCKNGPMYVERPDGVEVVNQ